MNIISIKYQNPNDNSIQISLIGGGYRSMNYPVPTRYADELQDWLDDGNTINPYVAPPIDPKDQARIDAIPILNATRLRPDVTPITQADFNNLLDYLGIS